MDTQPMAALEIEPAVPSTPLGAPDANDRSERCSPTPEPAWRAITRWLVDALLRGGAEGPAFYGEIWRDPTTFFPHRARHLRRGKQQKSLRPGRSFSP